MIKVITNKIDESLLEEGISCLKSVKDKSCKGKDFLGWLELPEYINSKEYKNVKKIGKEINQNADVLLVLGIGGSYLGARAAIEFLLSEKYNELTKTSPKIYFLGNGINARDINNILSLCKEKSVYVNVISKSGTTLEPAVAFRIIKEYMEKRYSKEECSKRIIVTTDKEKGCLKELSKNMGYRSFIVPDNVGGRYSVLTAVGLLPIAAAGINTDKILKGAAKEKENAMLENEENHSLLYAVSRQQAYRAGKKIEILSTPSESTRFFAEWWKQLFGESEGKDGLGIFPASVVYTADLHSMGQYIQDGERSLFETGLFFEEIDKDITIKATKENLDGLNYLAGKNLKTIYEAARTGVKAAHESGNVPCTEIKVTKQDEENLGRLIYFFEVACSISALLTDVNPFNQPGVESYKQNMFKNLGRN